jgi:hypothetical protein
MAGSWIFFFGYFSFSLYQSFDGLSVTLHLQNVEKTVSTE